MQLKAHCGAACDDESHTGNSEEFKIKLKDLLTKSIAIKKKIASTLVKTTRSRNRSVFEEVETTLDSMKEVCGVLHTLAKTLSDKTAPPAAVTAACQDARDHGLELSSTMSIINWRCACLQKMMFQDYMGVCSMLDTSNEDAKLILKSGVEADHLKSIAAAIVEDIVMRSLENNAKKDGADDSFALDCVQCMLQVAGTRESFLAKQIAPDLQVFAHLTQTNNPSAARHALSKLDSNTEAFHEQSPLRKFLGSDGGQKILAKARDFVSKSAEQLVLQEAIDEVNSCVADLQWMALDESKWNSFKDVGERAVAKIKDLENGRGRDGKETASKLRSDLEHGALQAGVRYYIIHFRKVAEFILQGDPEQQPPVLSDGLPAAAASFLPLEGAYNELQRDALAFDALQQLVNHFLQFRKTGSNSSADIAQAIAQHDMQDICNRLNDASLVAYWEAACFGKEANLPKIFTEAVDKDETVKELFHGLLGPLKTWLKKQHQQQLTTLGTSCTEVICVDTEEPNVMSRRSLAQAVSVLPSKDLKEPFDAVLSLLELRADFHRTLAAAGQGDPFNLSKNLGKQTETLMQSMNSKLAVLEREVQQWGSASQPVLEQAGVDCSQLKNFIDDVKKLKQKSCIIQFKQRGVLLQNSIAKTGRILEQIPEAPKAEASFIKYMVKNGNLVNAAKDELEKHSSALRGARGSEAGEDTEQMLATAHEYGKLLYNVIALYAMVCLLRNPTIRNASSKKMRESLRGVLNCALQKEIRCPEPYMIESCEVLGMEMPGCADQSATTEIQEPATTKKRALLEAAVAPSKRSTRRRSA